MATQLQPNPIRAGVFHKIEEAEQAVRELKEHGFTDDQITVVCSDRATESHFRQYEHQEPAGFYSRSAVAGGAVIGFVLGAMLSAVIVLVTEADVFLLGLTMLCGLTGALFGGFLGEMLTRGLERELANFYDQEVQRGDILVAAEDHGDGAAAHLDEARLVLEQTGARSLELSEG